MEDFTGTVCRLLHESVMPNGCLTVTQDISKSLVVLPPNLAVDDGKVR